MLGSITAVLPIFLLIISGFFAKKYFLPSADFWRSAEALTYYLLFPCLLVLKISSIDFDASSSLSLIATTIVATIIVGLVSFLMKRIFKIPNPLFTSIFQGSTRYNSYVFLGMAASLLGPDAVGLTGIFIAYMIVVTNFFSVLVMNRYGSGEKKSTLSVVKKVVTNPLILGALIGGLFNFSNLKISGFIHSYMDILGGAASPLSLLAVGAGLQLTMKAQQKYAISLAICLKLLLMPAITLAFIAMFGLKGPAVAVAVLYSALPCAGNSYILARQMGGDTDSMASIITFSTLASMLTCPFFLVLG